MDRKSELMRVDPEFKKLVKQIPLLRLRNGKDNFLRPTAQITKAMLKHKDFQKIIRDIEEVEK